MKKLLITAILLVSTVSHAQTQLNRVKTSLNHTQPSNDLIIPNTPTSGFYVSAGLSVGLITKGDFQDYAYPSLEFGGYFDVLSLGLVVGRGNFANFGRELRGNNIENYWCEIKTSVSQPIWVTNGYLLFGVGNYIDTAKPFIEYGLGFNYTPNKVGFFVQTSNWDGLWYNSFGVTYLLN